MNEEKVKAAMENLMLAATIYQKAVDALGEEDIRIVNNFNNWHDGHPKYGIHCLAGSIEKIAKALGTETHIYNDGYAFMRNTETGDFEIYESTHKWSTEEGEDEDGEE